MNCPHWLLALTIPFSRSDRAHTSPAGVGAGCAEGLLRTMPASLLQLPEGLGGPFRRECHCTRRVTERQRVSGAEFRPGGDPGIRPLPTDRSGTPAVPGGCPLERSGSLRRQVERCTGGDMRKLPCPPHATRCSKFQRAFRPLLFANQAFGGRAPPADVLDLPHVTTMRWSHDALRLLHGCDRPVTRR
jgi:hypothetical protein